ncbi:hypothetical protein AB0G32_15395 [Streptomyces sp. NPDC023723]|uniref:hypothetical protein n=1 Tax=Streptomyces sp. NPDC023723 TaxID=3154323 RepID=UPI00340AEAA0
MHAQERLERAGAADRARHATVRPPTPPVSSGASDLLRLQRAAGNQAVGRALHGDGHGLSVQRAPGPPPPPAPAPPPMAIRAAAPKAPSADTLFELPSEHTKVRSIVPDGKLPLKNKLLVTQVLRAYYGVNRLDMVEQIKARYEQVNGTAYVEPPDLAERSASERPGYKDSDAYIPDTPDGNRLPHWPAVPGGSVKVHGGSLESFAQARPGQAFTGLVRFGGVDDNGAPIEPKIILFPTQSTGAYLSDGVAEFEPENEDNPPEMLANSRVYQNRYSTYTTHAGRGALSSHGKLASRIQDKKKYQHVVEDMEADDIQSAGLTIGFTVIKGGGPAAHKYSFVSRSSNTHVFGLLSHEEKATMSAKTKMKALAERGSKFGGGLMGGGNGEGSVTKEWGAKIIASVNAATG